MGRFTKELSSRNCYIDTHTSGDVTFVEGRDPDDIRIVIAYPSPSERPRSILDSRFYS
ncbi:hypothetical protein [Paramicrobacterium humi]|uniref:hypothetical protein n=1 Tax=Paramicrobacterium humi TaxID=640635 RepID=UPI00159FED5B|nr:hypothetical protein [Microbacterium humi]